MRAAGALWSIFAITWIVMSFGRKAAVRREPFLARLAHLVYMAAAFILLFRRDLPLGALDTRVVPDATWVEAIGVTLTLAGVALAIWSRVHLGIQWSADVTIREGHRLIASGPYALIRHPIYTGILTAMLGTAMIAGAARGFLAVLLAGIGFGWKAKKEERFLEQEFGPAYEEHRRRTGFFLPRLG